MRLWSHKSKSFTKERVIIHGCLFNMEKTETAIPRKDRPKVMLAARRRRLGSMPSRFPQTDEELRQEVLKKNAHATSSLYTRDRALSDIGILRAGIPSLRQPIESGKVSETNSLEGDTAICQSPSPYNDGEPKSWTECSHDTKVRLAFLLFMIRDMTKPVQWHRCPAKI